MQYLYGKDGVAVGSVDAGWLFDELGKPKAFLSESRLYSPEMAKRVGSWRGDVLYDENNTPLAVGDKPKLGMLQRLEPRVKPLPPRLLPMGTNVTNVGPIALPPAFAAMALARSLQEFAK